MISTSRSNMPSTRHAAWRSDPDLDLMLRVRDDVPGAFEELIHAYWGRVYARVFRMIGDRQEAEDLAQDVFLRIYRNRLRYQARARLSTWIFHIARNVVRNAIRGRLRRPVVSLTRMTRPDREDVIVERLKSASQDAPSRRAEQLESASIVRCAIAGLAWRQRTAIELQFQDRSYSEIAAELAMTPKAAKSLLYRARLQLRDNLNRFMTCEA